MGTQSVYFYTILEMNNSKSLSLYFTEWFRGEEELSVFCCFLLTVCMLSTELESECD